jgi:1-phosphofructokinase family hexose kinase
LILCVNLNPCVDKTLFVDSLRMGEVQPASRVTVTVGGKANNVARVLKSFGREAVAMNVLGSETGQLCERLLREDDGLDTETVWTKAPTREIITIYETGVNRHTDIKEAGPVISGAEREEFIQKYLVRLSAAEFVSFGGSSPCPSVDDLPAELVRLAQRAGVPFVLDTYGKALMLGLAEQPFMVKPNRAEAEALFGNKIASDAGARDALEQLAVMTRLAVLTSGEEGFLAAYEGKRYRVHSPKVTTVDAVGSGDAVVALVLMGLLDNLPFEKTLARAAAAGAANAASILACKIKPDDVEPLVAKARVERL